MSRALRSAAIGYVRKKEQEEGDRRSDHGQDGRFHDQRAKGGALLEGSHDQPRNPSGDGIASFVASRSVLAAASRCSPGGPGSGRLPYEDLPGVSQNSPSRRIVSNFHISGFLFDQVGDLAGIESPFPSGVSLCHPHPFTSRAPARPPATSAAESSESLDAPGDVPPGSFMGGYPPAPHPGVLREDRAPAERTRIDEPANRSGGYYRHHVERLA